MMRRRRGVAMATVLAVLALASVLAFATAEAGHLSLAGARNRAHEAAAYWLAQGCLARTVAELDSRWTVLDDLSRARFWRELDLETARSVRVPRDCRLTLRSGGVRLDLSRTTVEDLTRLVAAVDGRSPSRHVARAVMAWFDSLYVVRGTVSPEPLRHRALSAHLARATGIGETTAEAISTLLSNGTGPVDVARAPIAVLVALPGFNERIARAVHERGRRASDARDLYAVLGNLAQDDAEVLGRAFERLARETTSMPSTWIMRAEVARDGGAPIAVAWNVGRAPGQLVAAMEVR